MRKIILVFLIFIPLLSFSQFHFGVKGGGLISKINVEENMYPYKDNRTSFYLGAFGEYKFSYFSIHSSLEYMNLGAKGSGRMSFDDAYDYKHRLSINQINVSVIGKYYPIERLSIGVGGYFGYVLDSKMKSEVARGFQITEETYSFNEYLSDVDYGIIAGTDFFIYKGFRG